MSVMELSSGILLGVGFTSLGVGLALKFLESRECEIVLRPPPPSMPRHYNDFNKLQNDLSGNGMLSDVVIQGKVKGLTSDAERDGQQLGFESESADHDKPVLKSKSDLKVELARFGPAGSAISMGKLELYAILNIEDQEQLVIHDQIDVSDEPIIFSNPFLLKGSKNDEIIVQNIDKSEGFRSVLEPHNLHSILTGKLPLLYTRQGVQYNMLTYGSTIAVIGSAKLQDNGKKIIFTPEKVSDSLQSFIPQENLKTLPKNTSTILIIGGLSLIVVAGLIAVALLCFRRRKGKNVKKPIAEQGQ